MSWWTGKPAKDVADGDEAIIRRGERGAERGRRDSSADSGVFGAAFRDGSGRAAYVDPNETVAVRGERKR